jgi:8-oxo-dGTP pyrophosphatase MutT (NUDIX family)
MVDITEITHKIRQIVSPEYKQPPSGLIPAAVLVALIEKNGIPHIIFTKRTMSVATHKGQISFPGGAVEAADLSPADTALRETEEETGIAAADVTVLGYLSGLQTTSGFWIIPVVAVVPGSPEYSISPDEVAEIFEIPVDQLMDRKVKTEDVRIYNGVTFKGVKYQVDKKTIWGATATILDSLIKALQA